MKTFSETNRRFSAKRGCHSRFSAAEAGAVPSAELTEVTLVLRSTGGPLNVIVDEGGRICDIRGKTQQKGAKACVFTGIYGLETDILRHIEPGKPETVINTFVQRIVEQPGSIMGIVIDEGNWDDIGSPESYRNLVGRRGG